MWKTGDDLRELTHTGPSIPEAWKAKGFNHIGDIDVVGRYVYAPLEQPDYEKGQQATARFDRDTLRALTEGLSTIAACMEPTEAARRCAEAVATLTQALNNASDPYALADLAQCLSAVAARLEPKEAARRCAEAALTLSQALSKTTNPSSLRALAEGLSAMAVHMELKEAALRCAATRERDGRTPSRLQGQEGKCRENRTLWHLGAPTQTCCGVIQGAKLWGQCTKRWEPHLAKG